MLLHSGLVCSVTRKASPPANSLTQWTCSPYSLFVDLTYYLSVCDLPPILPHPLYSVHHHPSLADLGVQRGVCHWFLALHDRKFNISISPDKLPLCPDDEEGLQAQASGKAAAVPAVPITTNNSTPPTSTPVPEDASSIPPAAPVSSTPKPTGTDTLAPPVTPSVNKTLSNSIATPNGKVEPLPEGLKPEQLKARLKGQQKYKLSLSTGRKYILTPCISVGKHRY